MTKESWESAFCIASFTWVVQFCGRNWKQFEDLILIAVGACRRAVRFFHQEKHETLEIGEIRLEGDAALVEVGRAVEKR